MFLRKDNAAGEPIPTPVPDTRDLTPRVVPAPKPELASAPAPVAAPPKRVEPGTPGKESLIAADITIEGKIEGGGSVRIAGKFKGDVNVHGDLTIEIGAKLTGSVRADKVTIAGELEGNVQGASRIDLQQTGSVIGDLKANSLTVAAGATMRGKAEFGGENGEGPKGARPVVGNGAEIVNR